MRGIAALIVSIYHFTRPGHLPLPFTPALVLHGYLAVDLFFILSGFVLALTYGNLFRQSVDIQAFLRFMAKRAARVYPAYFLISAFALIYHRHQVAIPNVGGFAGNLLMMQGWGLGVRPIIADSWSVSAEVLAYFAFPFLVTAVFKHSIFRQLALGAAILGIALVYRFGHGALGPLDVSSDDSVFPVVRCFAGFVLGVVAFITVSSPRVSRLLASTTLSNGVFLASVSVICFVENDMLVFLAFAPLVMALYADGCLARAIFGNRIAQFFGTISYSFYLLHPYVQGFSKRAGTVLGRGHGEVIQNLLALTFAVAASTLLAAFCFYLVETPGRRLLRGGIRAARLDLPPTRITPPG